MPKMTRECDDFRVSGDSDGLDELVVGGWLHVERTDTKEYAIDLCGRHGWVDIVARAVRWEGER